MKIPYGRQDIQPDDMEAVMAVLRSDFVTQGPAVPRFETALAAYCNASHAIATSSATAALHIACLALDLGPGDWLWTSPNTFVATANCALYCGASVDFVDIDPRTYNMCADGLSAKLAHAEAEGRLPKIVVPVHYAGQPCDMRRIHELSNRYGFRIIEDAAHAVGARYLARAVGGCQFSDITIFSFHPVKIITTGEGGMALTNDPKLAARMERLRSHGVTRAADLLGPHDEGPWFYQQLELGLNYRLTDIQAALGASQLRRIDTYIASRHKLGRRYDDHLEELSVTPPYQHPDGISALHLYPIWIDPKRHPRIEVFNALRAKGIGVNVHYIPVYTQPYYRALGFQVGQCPNSERYYAGTISLPMFPTLTESQQDYVINALRHALM